MHEHSAVNAKVAARIAQRFNRWHENGLAEKRAIVQSSKESVDGATMGRGNGDRAKRICPKPALPSGVDLAYRLSKDAEIHPMVCEGKGRDINRLPQNRRL